MQSMLRLMNSTHIVFFPVGYLEQAKQYRSTKPEFKGRHISNVLQAYPSKIKYGQKMERT